MGDDLREYSKKVQDAWQLAISTKSIKDFEEFKRLEDEYYILLENDRHRRKRNYITNTNADDC